MQTADLKITDGGAAGAWIEPRLGGDVGAVTLFVPKDYEAYARIFHPVVYSDGKLMRWAEIAETVGRTAHSGMEWDELAAGPGWYGEQPPTGEMNFFDLDALCEVLSARTANPGACYFGLRTTKGWLDAYPAVSYLHRFLRLPEDRDYIVLAGPLAAIGQITRDGKWREAPNLIWPDDNGWFLASDVGLDSTLIGGSAELIEAIVQAPALEAWQVEPTDSLTVYPDEINEPQEG